MNEKEIRAKYEAQVCATQMEFDRLMSEMNTEQTHLNHPYLDRERELAKQKELLEQQKQAINIQLNAIKLEPVSHLYRKHPPPLVVQRCEIPIHNLSWHKTIFLPW